CARSPYSNYGWDYAMDYW
nr:immunoglobulin heavy chain junction region [Mus musculus]